MKNKMTDVRNHLVAMMEELGTADECKPETVERAKAMSMVCSQYIASVKAEIDAAKIKYEYNHVVEACEQHPRLESVPKAA